MSASDPKVAIVHDLVQTFIEMFKKRQPTTLLPWLKAASESGFKALGSFADGLRKDINAVMASLILAWSNGQVEGQVNRLKFIKRQMYGRANFDLLRRRVLGQQDTVVV